MVPDAIRRRIHRELDRIELDEGVRILFAVESGSRAWGFPSPDSDYDVRFVYARPLPWCVRLSNGRDVIERPIVDDLDVGEWDLRRAMNLLVRANPALIEWLSSPIVYREGMETNAIRELAEACPHRHSAHHHYRAVAWNNYSRHITGRRVVKLKKYMYRIRPDRVPMDFPSLLTGITFDVGLRQAIDALLALKANSLEMGEAPRIPAIDSFIEHEVPGVERPGGPLAETPGFRERAEALFQSIVLGRESMG